MTFKIRQKTRVADSACVAMLCMVSTMVLGFSTPQQSVEDGASIDIPLATLLEDTTIHTSLGSMEEDSSTDVSLLIAEDNVSIDVPLVTGEEGMVAEEEGKASPDGLVLASLAESPVDLDRVVRRPKSLTHTQHLLPLIDKVDGQLWLTAADASLESSLESSLGVIDAAPEHIFRGVGFPDIRTYDRGKRSVFDPPGPWAPLVTWRSPAGEEGASEPIAKVRCMGLSPHAVARRADLYREVIYEVAQQHDINPHLVKAVIAAESCFNNKALSSVGAQGLMQLMPDTASWLDVSDPHDPVQNLSGGIRYLAYLQTQFDTIELALAAYNAGPGNVRRYNGIPPFAETQAYVVKVQAHYRRFEAAHQLLTAADDTLQQANSLFIP